LLEHFKPSHASSPNQTRTNRTFAEYEHHKPSRATSRQIEVPVFPFWPPPFYLTVACRYFGISPPLATNPSIYSLRPGCRHGHHPRSLISPGSKPYVLLLYAPASSGIIHCFSNRVAHLRRSRTSVRHYSPPSTTTNDNQACCLRFDP
jgi:hypothetical protein